MNKKILISLCVIGAVAAIAIGGTVAYFSDTETSKGNTFSTGVIDITVEPGEKWSQGWDIVDMKPSETGYINFVIHNPGKNPVNVWKTIKNITTSDGTVNEPECIDQGGNWVNYGQGYYCSGGTPKSNLHDWMYYDLSVKVSIPENSDGGWRQTIYKDSDHVTVGNIQNTRIFLGMVPAGKTMEVTQSYHLQPETGNWAQSDTMTFDIEVYAEQLRGELVLENKSGAPDWQILGTDNMKGTLTYNLTSPTFDYDFHATGLDDVSYQLIYYPDPWTSPKKVKLIGNPMVASLGAINVTGKSVDLGIDLPDWNTWQDQNHPEGAKIWLVPTSSLSLSGSDYILSWTNTNKFLFETGLITYKDTNK